MADDHTLRSYRSNDSNRSAAAPARAGDRANDPLAELARLIGQNDPFAEFGRTNSRQGERQAERPGYAAPSTAPDEWQHSSARDPQLADEPASRGYGAHGAEVPLDQHAADEAPLAADHQDPQYDQGQQYDDGRTYDDQHYDDRMHGEAYYEDDVALEPHEDDMYDDPPRAHRRGGLATVLALVGCAVLGTAGAYTYRSYFSHPSSTLPPPVITADTSTPTKIIPATAGDPQSGKAVQDRLANADKEQVVSKQEEPLALKELAAQAAPTAVLPPPVAAQQPSAGPSNGTPAPKKVRTVTIRPDGGDVSGKPVTAAPAHDAAGSAPWPTTPPAPRAGTAPARNGGPISLDPQTSEPAAAPPARTRTARTSPPQTESAARGFVVQLSSQKSEAEAQSSFRSLQAKFPNELGDRQPIIRRADLGSKGVFYRTMVGPFASVHEASQFCASYKAAGGQCVVPSN